MKDEKDPGKKGTQEEKVPELESDKNDALGYSPVQVDLDPDNKDNKEQPPRQKDVEKK